MIDFSPLDTAFKAMFWTLVVSVPLGLWKLVEIIIWLFTNVTVNVG